MHHSEESFTASDGLSIFTQSWLPETTPTAIIILVHGYGEHSGRYSHVAEMLVQAGYGVYTLDHRGHGKSAGLRAYYKSIDEPVRDLEQYFQHVQQQHPNQKIFMIGHSMGSLIALKFALRNQAKLAGLVLSGTAVNSTDTVPGYQRGLLNILRSVAPTFPLVPSLSADALSTDPQTVHDYDADPLNYRGSWRIGLAAELLKVSEELQARANELTLPLLVMHGETDEITPIAGAHTIYNRASSTDKTLKTYPGMRHEIFNELEREIVFADLRGWLQTH
ncbi:MAG: lysophospholipase [Anaerolineae bacterium]|nr:lysophospholipase [Anaerolineae bacterium]